MKKIYIFKPDTKTLRAAVQGTAGFKNRPLLLSSIACNAEGRNLFPAASAAARTYVRAAAIAAAVHYTAAGFHGIFFLFGSSIL
jgi:PPE-repeat protein